MCKLRESFCNYSYSLFVFSIRAVWLVIYVKSIILIKSSSLEKNNDMQKYMIFTLLVVLCPAISYAQTGEDQKIMEVLNKQVECWNKGDLECFMTTYWRSDSLKFAGSRGVTYGWQNTLDNYRKAYPDQKTMGKLRFEILSMEAMGEDRYFVKGKFFLTREIGDASGSFSLIWKKVKGNWVIISDHTTSAEN